MKKKIAICNYYMGMGGTEKAMLALMNSLDPEVVDITLYLHFLEGPLLGDIPKWVTVKEIPFIKEKYRSYTAQRIPFTGFQYKKRLLERRLVKMFEKTSFENGELFESAVKYTVPVDEEYDAVLDFFGYGAFGTHWARGVLKSKKYATWLHDSDQNWTVRSEKVYPEYDKIFAVSKQVYDNFVKKYPLLSDKTEIFLNLIDCSTTIERAKETIPEAEFTDPTIVTVGRVTPQKGPDLALDTAGVLKERGIDFRWVFIGPGDDLEKYRSLSKERGLSDVISFVGGKINPYPFMKNADVYAQTSRFEGYPITLIEARALLCPIVVTDMPCAREQLSDNETASLVPFDKEAFADAIQELLENDSKRERYIDNLKKQTIDFSGEIKKFYQLL